MSRVSEGKKGRVICGWCDGDMGEAETELDTHEICPTCLEVAMREVDEELGALEQGQAAVAASSRGQAADRGGMR